MTCKTVTEHSMPLYFRATVIPFVAAGICTFSARAADEAPQAPAASRAPRSQLFRNDTMFIMSLLRNGIVQSDLQLDEPQKIEISKLHQARESDLKRLTVAV